MFVIQHEMLFCISENLIHLFPTGGGGGSKALHCSVMGVLCLIFFLYFNEIMYRYPVESLVIFSECLFSFLYTNSQTDDIIWQLSLPSEIIR